MNCREFVDFILAYSEDELDPKLRAAFERHVGACPPCMCYLDGYKKVGRAARAACAAKADEGPVSDKVPEGLVKAILAARAEVDDSPA